MSRLTLGVRVPVTTLCPCSKEISEYGAHNQRGYVDISARVVPSADLGFEDLIAIAEARGRRRSTPCSSVSMSVT